MAFKAFQKLEPVEFGDFEAEPVITTEVRMRLSTLKFVTDSDLENAKDVIAKAFGSKEADIKKYFAENYVIPSDLAILATYLTSGRAGVEQLDKKLDYAMQKETDKALEAMNNE